MTIGDLPACPANAFLCLLCPRVTAHENLAALAHRRERDSGSGTLSAHADLQTEIILMEMLYDDDDYYYYYYYGGKHCCSALWHKEKP